MNMSAPFRPTISTTLSSSGWSAPAWNTASCPAPACGVRRTPSLVPFQLAPTILSGQKNLLLLARPFSTLVREPGSNGSSSAVSAHLNRSPDCQLLGRGRIRAALIVANNSSSQLRVSLATRLVPLDVLRLGFCEDGIFQFRVHLNTFDGHLVRLLGPLYGCFENIGDHQPIYGLIIAVVNLHRAHLAIHAAGEAFDLNFQKYLPIDP